MLPLLCLFYRDPVGYDGIPKGDQSAPWQDAVAFRLPDDPVTKERVTRAAKWLTSHRITVTLPDDKLTVPVIAWKDPTLEPSNPKLLAGYLITDTLWSAKALKVIDPIASQEMEQGLQHLGWYGNGLQDVLFHPIERSSTALPIRIMSTACRWDDFPSRTIELWI